MKKTWPEYREELCSLEQPRVEPIPIVPLHISSLATVGEEFWLGQSDEDELLLLTWFARPGGERQFKLEKSSPSGQLVTVQDGPRVLAPMDHGSLRKLAPLPSAYGHVMTSLPRKGEKTWPSLALDRMVISKIWAEDPGVRGPQIMSVAWALAGKSASELKAILAMFRREPGPQGLRLSARALADLASAPGLFSGIF